MTDEDIVLSHLKSIIILACPTAFIQEDSLGKQVNCLDEILIYIYASDIYMESYTNLEARVPLANPMAFSKVLGMYTNLKKRSDTRFKKLEEERRARR